MTAAENETGPRSLAAIELPRRADLALRATVVAGAAIFIAGLAIAPERAWRGYLVAFLYFLGLGLGGAVFLAIQHLVRAGWSTSLRRVPEAMTAALPVAALLFIPVVAGAGSIYEWTHADAVLADAALRAKSAWLWLPFFAARSAVYFAVWIALSRALVRRSRRQDEDGALEHTLANGRRAAAFLVAFGVTFTAAMFDWVMSLAPHWYSTVYAVYHWAGLFLSALAAMTLIVLALRRAGVLAIPAGFAGHGRAVVKNAQILDLGRLILGFSTFWAYIWVSQYLLIWYSNIPEETAYYMDRTSGAFGTLFVVNLAVNWAVPFLALLPRGAKQDPGTLSRVCALILLGRFLDLYLDVSQPVLRGGPSIGPLEVAPVVAAVALFSLVFLRAFGAAAPVPVRDPLLVECA